MKLKNTKKILIALCLTAAVSWCPTPSQAAEHPNIIFILADDLGYGDLGCYGQQRIKTPEIDKLAAEGIRFTQAYAGSTVCAPSRCVLMTGLHTGHAWIRGNRRIPLRPEDTTIAEILKEQGYRTALIGKWGLGEPDTTGVPNSQGFDYFFGYLNQRHAHNYYPTFLYRNREKVGLPNVVPNEDKAGAGMASKKLVYSHDLFTKEALYFIKENKEEPFFLYLSYTIPHANNEAGNKGMEVPDYGIYTDKNWPDAQKGHAAMITRMDRDVGKIRKLLETLGIAENTIVFFTSDNGPHSEGGNDPDFNNSNGPLRGIKRDLYEGGIRVPAIVWWPEHITPGRVNDTPWYFADFLPTAAAAAGADAPDDIDGVNILPVITGERKNIEPRFLFWEFHERGYQQAARWMDWKVVRKSPEAPLELYNLTADIGEKHNLADAHPKIVKKFEDYLESARTVSEFWKINR
ncbi:MAG: arylsulfatase [Verrucomicrobia bacterium]|nr:arylsulfatase [Verrucomicrobiota bacterium]